MFSPDITSCPWHYYAYFNYHTESIYDGYYFRNELIFPPGTWQGKKICYTFYDVDRTWTDSLKFGFDAGYAYEKHQKGREERRQAFAMGLHERLGNGSIVRLLDPCLVKMILRVYHWH